ncbi:DUF6233 domain-containing protein [Streptomyces sp. NPDC001389]|uniref:DUF6233 domain-containing protein n=1 Tax=Streptomyces sp. NPDC001389 TaxID=3364569 RepID=UPI0036758800
MCCADRAGGRGHLPQRGRGGPCPAPSGTTQRPRPQPFPWGGRLYEGSRRCLPPPPAWLIEHGIGTGRPAVRVHTGACWDTRTRCKPTPPGGPSPRASRVPSVPPGHRTGHARLTGTRQG